MHFELETSYLNCCIFLILWYIIKVLYFLIHIKCPVQHTTDGNLPSIYFCMYLPGLIFSHVEEARQEIVAPISSRPVGLVWTRQRGKNRMAASTSHCILAALQRQTDNGWCLASWRYRLLGDRCRRPVGPKDYGLLIICLSPFPLAAFTQEQRHLICMNNASFFLLSSLLWQTLHKKNTLG